jgi:hypothetical protein
VTRRLFNRNHTTEGAPVGVEWHDRAPVVSNLDRPRISHPETEYATKAAAERAALGDSLDEPARARRLLDEDERLARVAVVEFVERAKAWDELGGWQTGSEQQQAELDRLDTLLAVARGRGTVMRARLRDQTGLYRESGQ